MLYLEFSLVEKHEKALKKIGDRLKKLRIEHGHTSYENFAFEHDLPRMQYWRIENGKTNVTIKTLIKILDIYKIELKDFFSQIDNK